MLFGIPHTVKSHIKVNIVHPDITIRTPLPNNEFICTIHEKLHPHFLRYSEYRTSESFILSLNRGIATNKGINLTRDGGMIPIALDRYFFDKNEKEYISRKLWRKSHSNFFPQKHFNFSVANLIINYSDDYFHWIYDVLPKINLIKKQGLRVDKIFVKAKDKVRKDALKLLGYSGDKLIDASQFNIISAKRLIIPYISRRDIKHPEIYKFLRKSFVKASVDYNKLAIGKVSRYKRIYISRKKVGYRKVINEYEVVKLLNKYGFVEIELESMSFIDQVWLFNNAKIIVAPHGSGLANIVFSKKATKIIEIFNPNYVYPCYYLISNLLRLRYYYFVGSGKADVDTISRSGKKELDKMRHSDIKVDLGRLENMVKLSLEI